MGIKNKKLTPDEFKAKPHGSDQFGNMPSDFPKNNAPTFNIDNQQVSKAYYDVRKAQLGFSGGGDASLLTPEEKAKLASTPEMQAKQQQAQSQVQVKQLLQEEQPERTELNAPQSPLQNVPIIGGLMDSIGGALANVIGKKDAKPVESLGIINPVEGGIQLSPQEKQRQLVLQAEAKAIQDGVTSGDQLGAIIESIPFVGALANKFARGLINTPKGSINELTAQIKLQGTGALDDQRNAKLSPEMKEISYANVEMREDKIRELEGKIKQLVLCSAEARANPEEIDKIEEEILNAKKKLLRIKANIINNVAPVETVPLE